MILLLLCAISLAVFIPVSIVCWNKDLVLGCVVAAFVSVVCAGVMFGTSIVAISNHALAAKRVLIYENKRNSIVRVLENTDATTSLINAPVLTEINQYNEDVVEHQAFIGNNWIGFMYPEEFAALEPIDLEEYL